jgi:hypothetical protein
MNNSKFHADSSCIEILKEVGTYRFLTLRQLEAIFRNRWRRKLNATIFSLWKYGYLERLILTSVTNRISFHYVFALGRLGARQLTLTTGKNDYRYIRPNAKRSTIFLEHTLLINNFRICFDILSKYKKDFQLENWYQAKDDVKIKLNQF